MVGFSFAFFVVVVVVVVVVAAVATVVATVVVGVVAAVEDGGVAVRGDDKRALVSFFSDEPLSFSSF